MEIQNDDDPIFNEILTVLNRHPKIDFVESKSTSALSLSGLEIDFDSREIFANREKIILTLKEYDILCLLAVNQGRILTYSQIYENVWNADALGSENKVIGYHIWNIRKKLYNAAPDLPVIIENAREVGYGLKVNT